MKNMSVITLFALSACGLVGGCAMYDTGRARYVDPNEIVAGVPDKQTMYDLESSAGALMQKMLVSSQFLKNYNVAKSVKGGTLPIAVIGNIANKTTERIQGRLVAVGDAVRSALFNSGLFEVKDDDASGSITSRILRGADGGLEDGAPVQAIGTHESPDFMILGDFRHFSDVGSYHTYRLRLAIHNLKTGKIVWEGIQTKVKL